MLTMKKNRSEFVPLARNSLGPHQKKVKHYILGGALGEGSFGKVKEALDTRTHRLSAVKIIKKRSIQKIPGGEESVEREVEMLRKVHHINCISLYDFIEDDEKDKLYIVCERVGGGSIHELCERAPDKRLPLIQARNLFLQLLDAMEYLHGLKIVHRDLKPDNMLLTVDGILKVSDFGSALQFDKEYAAPAPKTKGSPAFQPPEIISSSDHAFSGPKIDIWASGVTLYIMCIGSFPFEGASVSALFENISNARFVIPSWVDPSLANLIQSILTKDRRKRASIEEIRRHPWMSAKLKKEKFIPLTILPTLFDDKELNTCSCTIL